MLRMLFIFMAALWLPTAAPLSAQVALSGRITDQSGEPLAGAAVYVPALKKGTASDAEGQYQLELPRSGAYELRISFIGYQTLAATADVNAPGARLDFALSPAAIPIEELVVSATRAGRKTPMTYLNLSREELTKNNLGQDVPYLLQWTPSAIVSSDAGAGIGYTGIRIRGTDPTRINVTINGIPLNDAESQGVFWVNLPDFASSAHSVQIQRGVGTSTNGAGAFGATINLNTFDLNREAYAEVNASAGSFNTLKGNVRFGSGLLNERFILEGRLSRILSDGYIDRARSDLQSYFLAGTFLGRASSMQLNLFSGHEQTYQAWYGVPAEFINDRRLRTFNPAGMEKEGEPYDNEIDNYRQTHAQLLYNRQLGRQWLLNANLHYTRGYGYFEQYKAAQALEEYQLLAPGNDPQDPITHTDLIRRLWLDNHFHGTTYALTYGDENAPWQHILGGAYNIYEGDHFGEVIWARFFADGELGDRYYENDARKTDFNLYSKTNRALSDRLNAFVDLQYRRVDYRFLGFNRQGENVTQTARYDFFNPKAGLFYSINPRAEAYASFAVANREPNRNDFTETTVDSRPRPERLYNTEAGMRYRWAKAALELNAYHMYYRDQLALNGQINDVGAYTRVNIPHSYRLGIEAVGGVRLAEGLRLEGNATLSRNRVRAFTEFIDVYDENFEWQAQAGVERRDTELSFSPAVIAAAEISYEFLRRHPRHGFDAALSTKYISRQYLDNTSDPQNAIDPYSYSDARLRYRWKGGAVKTLELTLLVQNVFDALFVANGWSYRYRLGGETMLDQGFYPQAGRNFLLGARLLW